MSNAEAVMKALNVMTNKWSQRHRDALDAHNRSIYSDIPLANFLYEYSKMCADITTDLQNIGMMGEAKQQNVLKYPNGPIIGENTHES